MRRDPACGSVRRRSRGEHLLQRRHECVDLGARAPLGDGHDQHVIARLRHRDPGEEASSTIASITSVAGRGSRTANSLKQGSPGKAVRHPRQRRERRRRVCRPSTCTAARARRGPRDRATRGRSAAAIAISVWFVQMLEFALSRRMCCSRACRVSTYPVRPSTSTVSPTMRPGQLADVGHARSDDAEVRPAVVQMVPEPLPLPDGDVGAELPRATRARRARAGRRSGSRWRPPSCAAANRSRAGSSTPYAFGCCTTTAATSSRHTRLAVERLRLVPRSPAGGPQGLDGPRIDAGGHQHPVAARPIVMCTASTSAVAPS